MTAQPRPNRPPTAPMLRALRAIHNGGRGTSRREYAQLDAMWGRIHVLREKTPTIQGLEDRGLVAIVENRPHRHPDTGRVMYPVRVTDAGAELAESTLT